MKLTATTAAAALTILCAPLAGAQTPPADPQLQQQVTTDEELAPAGEHVVITSGHVDLGATFVDGELAFLARDDTRTPPVWRHLDDVVFDVTDDALQTLPENGPVDFDFTGADPGDSVWVIPQTEVAGVPWLGWNTQAPALLERATNGVTLEFGGHHGDGDFSLFLQPGGIQQPQQLWNSRLDGTQPMWIEPNTHTHANWVFTEPGVHLINVKVTVQDDAGEVHTDEQVLRLAVAADPAEAAAAEFTRPAASDGGHLNWILIAAAVVAVLAAVVFLARRRRIRG